MKQIHNTELNLAIALTKVENYAQAEMYAKRGVKNLERDLKINRTIPIEQNICTSSKNRDMNKFKLRMESLCLGYHHLGIILQKSGQYSEAIINLMNARALSGKYVRDLELKQIIENDVESASKVPNSIRYPSRSKVIATPTKRREVSYRSVRRSQEVSSTWTSSFKLPSTKQLLKELMNDTNTSKNKRRSRTRCSSVHKRDTVPSSGMLSGYSTGLDFNKMKMSRSNLRFSDTGTSMGETGMVSELGYDERSVNEYRMDIEELSSFKYAAEEKSEDVIGFNQNKQIPPTFRNNLVEITAEEDVESCYFPHFIKEENEGKKVTEVTLMEEISKFKRLETAAIKIQRFYRLYLCRKRSSQHLEIDLVSESFSQNDKQPSVILDHESLIDSPISQDHIKVNSSDIIQETRRAEANDYCNLLTPEISIHKSMNGNSYTWTLKIAKISVLRTDLNITINLIGQGLSMADNIYSCISLQFQPDKCSDYRISFPFAFQTLWPIAEHAFQKASYTKPLGHTYTNLWPYAFQDSFPSIKTQDYDESSIQNARTFLTNLLESYSLSTHISGKILSAVPSVQSISYSVLDNPSEALYLQYKDGVIKNLSILSKHRESSSYIYRPTISSEGDTLERGVIHTEGMYLFLVLKIEKREEKKFDSCLVCYLHCMSNGWKDQVEIEWQIFERFMEIGGFKIYVPHVILAKTLPEKAKEVFYRYFEECIKIVDSKLRFDVESLEVDVPGEPYKDRLNNMNLNTDTVFTNLPSKLNLLLKKNFLADDTYPSLKVTYQTSVSQIDLNSYITSPEEPIIHLNSCQINGEKEPIRMKLHINSSNTAVLTGNTNYTGKHYVLHISNPDRIQKLAYISNQEIELTLSALEKKLQIIPEVSGKVMKYHSNSVGKEFIYKGVVNVEIDVYLMCMYYTMDVLHILLYSTHNSAQYFIELLPSDISLCFGISSLDDIYNLHSKNYKLQTIFSTLCIFRNILGKQIALKIQSSSHSKPLVSPLGKFYSYPLDSSPSQSHYYIPKHTIEHASNSSYNLMYIHSKPIIILQRSRFLFSKHCIITIIRHSEFDEWRVQLHFLQISRCFGCRLYESDLHNLSDEALNKCYSDSKHIFNTARTDVQVWELIAEEMWFESQKHHELVMRFDQLCVPMKEVVYSSYLNRGDSVYYIEMYFKSTIGLNDKFPAIESMKQAMKVVLSFRSFDCVQHLWMKANYRLDECLLTCINKNVLQEDVLFNSLFRYSDIKKYAPLFIQHIQFPSISRHIKQQLLPELSFLTTQPKPESTLDLFKPIISNSQRSFSSIVDSDVILYTTLYSLNPTLLISLCQNTVVDDFILKIYRPADGAEYRQTLNKELLDREIGFIDVMYKGGMYRTLCMRILEKCMDFIMSKII